MISNVLSDVERARGFVGAVDAIGLKDAPGARRDRRTIEYLRQFFYLEPENFHAVLGVALDIDRVSGGEEFQATIVEVCDRFDVDEEVAELALRLHLCEPRRNDPAVWSNGSSRGLFAQAAA